MSESVIDGPVEFILCQLFDRLWLFRRGWLSCSLSRAAGAVLFVPAVNQSSEAPRRFCLTLLMN